MVKVTSDEYVAIARIGRPVGLGGMCRIFPFGNTISEISLPYTLLAAFKKSGEEFILEKIARGSGDGLKAQFAGVTNRDAAEELKNQVLYIKKDALPEADEDEFYFYQLQGLSVETESGEQVGEITEVFNFPTTDALEVRQKNGQKVMVPFRKEIVIAVLLDEKKVVVDTESLNEVL